MIARMWRGWVHTARIEEYVDIVERTGMAGYRDTPGNRGAQLITRDLGDGRTELITLSWWDDLDQIRAFAGDEVGTAKYYPEDDEYLVDRETTVSHFEVAPPQELPSQEQAMSLVHLNLTVRDVAASLAFYQRWFGFDEPPRLYSDGTTFVSNADGFDLAFAPGDSHPPATIHFGFRCRSREDVRTLAEAMRATGVPITEASDEDDYVSVKCLDPDGYEVETYWES